MVFRWTPREARPTLMTTETLTPKPIVSPWCSWFGVAHLRTGIGNMADVHWVRPLVPPVVALSNHFVVLCLVFNMFRTSLLCLFFFGERGGRRGEEGGSGFVLVLLSCVLCLVLCVLCFVFCVLCIQIGYVADSTGARNVPRGFVSHRDDGKKEPVLIMNETHVYSPPKNAAKTSC